MSSSKAAGYNRPSAPSPGNPPSYRETVATNTPPLGCQHLQSTAGVHLPRGGGLAFVAQPRNYGSTPAPNGVPTQRSTQPAAPDLPMHFTMRHDPESGPGRELVVLVVMCALIAGTDHRLFGGAVFENASWLAVFFLSAVKSVLLDLLWSFLIAALTAFVFPINIIAFLIGIDWIIPGRPVTVVLDHSQEPLAVIFYVIALICLSWVPPLLVIRWALDWFLGYYPRMEHASVAA